ncbi:uncharacterized protein EDB93DRAFT_1051282, partial [Suillus bovinus]|uniref:uncharacterized protein n=1 Tax=Suillus bovinus TaxID=48563 RepID=UPI001B87A062
FTSCYCEENIYFLLHRFPEQAQVKITWDIFAVIISNVTRTLNCVALWSQLKASAANTAVI